MKSPCTQREGIAHDNVNPHRATRRCSTSTARRRRTSAPSQGARLEAFVARKASDAAFCVTCTPTTRATPTYLHAADSTLHLVEVTTEEAFVVHHFAADVVYSAVWVSSIRTTRNSATLRTCCGEHVAIHRGADRREVRRQFSFHGGSSYGSVRKPTHLVRRQDVPLNDLRKLMRHAVGDAAALCPLRQAQHPQAARAVRPDDDGSDGHIRLDRGGCDPPMQASYPSRSTYEELLRVPGNQLPKSTQTLPPAKQQVRQILLYGTRQHTLIEDLLGKTLVCITPTRCDC